ncbi:hypothetical protein VTI74DRAFT_265 [Chaetomium olivicolor]
MRFPHPKCHVNDSIEVVSDNSWLMGRKLLLSLQSSASDAQPSWSDVTSRNSPVLPRGYTAGDQAAVWRAGETFIKVYDMIEHPHITIEHVTLEFVRSKKPLDFEVPDVLYYGEWS